MSTSSPGRRGIAAAAAGTAVLAVAGVLAVVVGLQPSGGPPQPPLSDGNRNAATTSAPSAQVPQSAAAGSTLAVKTLPRSRPVELLIPSIGVRSAAFVGLGKQPDGSLEVPADFGRPGWFTDGPAPGQFGPAVIAGHVDSKNGPGLFYRLGALRPGAMVVVRRADGVSARFAVDKIERYAKSRFPTVAVYGDANHRSELRLITCGGNFDSRTGHYLDNVVAYAHLV